MWIERIKKGIESMKNKNYKIAVLTEEGDLIIHKVTREEIDKEHINGGDGFDECVELWLSHNYDLSVIQYQFINKIDLRDFKEVEECLSKEINNTYEHIQEVCEDKEDIKERIEYLNILEVFLGDKLTTLEDLE